VSVADDRAQHARLRDDQPAGASEPLADPRGADRSQGSMGSLELAAEIRAQASDRKAHDIVEIDLRGVLDYTDCFVICTGNTDRQTRAIHDGILEAVKRDHGRTPRRVEGLTRGDWILMDYLDVVVHIFTPQTREYYRLEQLWGEAPATGEKGPQR
jgi:ribosome-associated protein